MNLLVVNAVLAGLVALLSLIPLLMTLRLKRRLAAFARQPLQACVLPPAAVILPCKGLDPGFDDNIQALLAQDYDDLELLFVVAAADDPAHAALQRLLTSTATGVQGRNARLVVAGFSDQCAQKLTNQLAAIAQVSPRVGVLVFVDSDCRPDPGFVRRLVAPLQSASVGATTGYRWYHPPEATLGSLLRSTWNAGALPFLVDPDRVFAWGGAMAIRRDTFARADLARIWSRAVSDDMTLTVAVRQLGLDVCFVPDCIAVSYESSTVPETLEFTNRQSLLARVYFPPLWWGTAIGHSVANLLMAYGLVSLLLWARTGALAHAVGAGCALLLPVQLANAAWMFGSAQQLLPASLRPALDSLRWHYVLTAPLASIMTLFNTVHSSLTRRMTWRGIEYELVSPTETIVHATKPAQ